MKCCLSAGRLPIKQTPEKRGVDTDVCVVREQEAVDTALVWFRERENLKGNLRIVVRDGGFNVGVFGEGGRYDEGS